MTRIVAGVAGGRRLVVPPRGTRPTSERVREAVFSAVQARRDLDGARVLDLYAGSGALGLEALSRGAGHVRFVESDRRAAAVLRRNVEQLGLGGAEQLGLGEPDRPGGAAEITVAPVSAVLQDAPEAPYDVVFADPPYALDEAALNGVLRAVAGRRWLAAGGLLVVERSSRTVPPSWPDGVVALTQRQYGDTTVYYGSSL